MTAWFEGLDAAVQALLAGLFTWVVTAIGAGLVFFVRTVSKTFLNVMLGFAAGVMIAASFFSLLLPAIDLSEDLGVPVWFPAVLGFLLGGAFLRLSDYLLPHLHLWAPMGEAEGIHTQWRKSTLLILAITLHNIPEGLAVGVAFGAIGQANGDSTATLGAAVALAIGIGLQNFPEGIAVAMPLRGEGMSRLRAWFFGQLSASVEPIAAVIGALAVVVIAPILPYALAFAAGAMIFVVVEELIPESQTEGTTDLATIATMLGFAFMMMLDVGLG